MELKHLRINLSLFDAAGGDGGGESSGDSGAESAPSVAGKSKGEYANVKFGKQAEEPTLSAADSNVTSDTLEERRKAYDDLIKGEYKDFYTKDTQEMINRRFKETKNLEKQVQDFKPLYDMLSQRYNASDIASIIEALEDDDSYWESAAYDAGMSVEQFKRVQKLERENKAFYEAQQQAEYNQEVDQQVNEWMEQAEAMKSTYPGFDLNEEIADPEFARLLQSGVPVRHAYEVLHMDEIKDALMNVTVQNTAKAVTDTVRARGLRPLENGASPQNAFVTKSDVSKLTKKDREEIARRVARGEVISF